MTIPNPDNTTKLGGILSPEPPPEIDYHQRNAQWEAEAVDELGSCTSGQFVGRAPGKITQEILAAERAEAEFDRKRDRRVENESETARLESERRRAEIRAAARATIARHFAEHVEPALQNLEVFTVEAATGADLGFARDSAHQAAITHACTIWDSILPPMAIELLDNAVRSNDRAMIKGLLPKAKTSWELAISGKRSYWQPYVRQLHESIDTAKAAAESRYTIRRKVAAKLAAEKRQQLGAYLQLLDLYSPRDPVFRRLATDALESFDRSFLDELK
jgi:hypothetical protein